MSDLFADELRALELRMRAALYENGAARRAGVLAWVSATRGLPEPGVAFGARRERRRSASAGLLVASSALLAVLVAVIALTLGPRSATRRGGSTTPGTAAPTIDGVKPHLPAVLSKVLAADGSVLGYIGDSGRVRTALSTTAIPRLLRAATVAIEDPQFSQRPTASSDPSPLTMRLVRLLYFPATGHDSGDRTQQTRIARGLAAARSKTWILTEYLNDANYGSLNGNTAIGAQAASMLFFGKPVARLDLAQTALLAALPDNPGLNSALQAPAARQERARVLRAMLAAGSITPLAAALAERSALRMNPHPANLTSNAPALLGYVTQNLRPLVPAPTIAQGGLIVHTTIDARDQAQALTSVRRRAGSPGAAVAALASVDPSTGHIVALADNRQRTFNWAVDAARPPGSAFTVFALLALIHDEDGDPAKTFYTSHFLAAGWMPGYPTYSVHNDETNYQGTISVTRAVATADNTAFAQLGADLGPVKISALAHAMGITARLANTPSGALGGLTTGVSALQMADADATLASGGLHTTPTIISAVTLPDRSTITARAPVATRVLSTGEAAEATHVLRTVLTAGTGTAADFGCPAAGKTGTTSNFTDAWFAGYTPTLATAVWLGYPNHRPLQAGFGGTLAAPIWHDYMQAANPHCSGPRFPTGPWSGLPYHGPHTATKR